MADTSMYICGCSVEEKKNYSSFVRANPHGDEYITNERLDAEGNKVCPEHGMPIKGYLPTLKSMGDGYKNGMLNLKPTVTTDYRDTRDPETLGKQILSKKNGKK